MDWQRLVPVGETNTDKLFSSFYNKLNKIVNKHAPLKPISSRKLKTYAKPWITRGIRKSIQVKNKLLEGGNSDLYKEYRNKLTILTRISKKLYFHKYFLSNANNLKKTWECINNLINRKKKNTKVIKSMKCPDNQGLSHDPLLNANILNSHFASVGKRLASQLPHPRKSYLDYLPNTGLSHSFVFEPVLPTEIETEIMLMPINKSHGLYSCPTRLLKCCRHIISKPIADMINNSVSKGSFPSKLKHAKIVPIFKDGDEAEPSNYRPISLLSIFNKLFEKMMYGRLKSFFNKYDIFYCSQYGFREHCSTDHAILDIVNRIQSNMDKKLFSCGVFIDLQKAFDTVDHEILLRKLHHYGIRGIVNDWFASYLIGRYQTTQIGLYISDKENTLCGVPQGSVLGPLLFLVYVNDMHYASSKLMFYLFADDTNLLYAHKDLKMLESVVNAELLNVVEWLTVNRLTLNIRKTNFMIFHPYQKRINHNIDIKIYDHRINKFVSLDRKEYVKYLGVIIDSHLSWKFHVDYVAMKISRNIGIISKLRHIVPLKTLYNIYNSLILPYLSYGLIIWGQAAKTHLEKLLMLQKRAVRLIHFAPFRSHAIPYFINSNIVPITLLYFKLSATLMHDIFNDSAPPNISDLFTLTKNVHHYKTRSSSSDNYYINFSKTNQHKNSFSVIGAKIWNSISQNTKELPKHLFKKEIQRNVFSILGQRDNYADLPLIIDEMNKMN